MKILIEINGKALQLARDIMIHSASSAECERIEKEIDDAISKNKNETVTIASYSSYIDESGSKQLELALALLFIEEVLNRKY